MKIKFKELIFTAIAIAVLVYAMFAFVIMNANPYYWSEESRIFLVFLWFMLTASAFSLYIKDVE